MRQPDSLPFKGEGRGGVNQGLPFATPSAATLKTGQCLNIGMNPGVPVKTGIRRERDIQVPTFVRTPCDLDSGPRFARP